MTSPRVRTPRDSHHTALTNRGKSSRYRVATRYATAPTAPLCLPEHATVGLHSSRSLVGSQEMYALLSTTFGIVLALLIYGLSFIPTATLGHSDDIDQVMGQTAGRTRPRVTGPRKARGLRETTHIKASPNKQID